MSKYEWEKGTFKLPSGVAPKMRKALAQAQNKYFDEVMAEAKAFWAANKTTSKKKLSEAISAEYKKYSSTGWYSRAPEMSKAKEKALNIFQTMTLEHNKTTKPHAPKIVDIASVVGPKATARTTEFRAGYEGYIVFKGNEVHWIVSENNHAVDDARGSTLGRVFFNELNKVQWTRNTGGKIVGNDEYNKETDWEGGGANYFSGGWGPLGDPNWKPAPKLRSTTKKSTGTHHKRAATVTKKGVARSGTVAKNPRKKTR